MALDLSGFRDPKLGRELIECINELAPVAVAKNGGEINLMEVCGTHTVTIARNGFRDILPDGVNLISGPGCPVCVTANVDIDTVIAIARIPGVIVTTFGDMTRVPGSTSSLNKEKAAGADIRIVYSPLDALKVASENPDNQVVFVGVGFETTTPLIAATIKRARAMGLANFSVVAIHKTMPNTLDVLVNDDEVKLTALILPGHVSTIIGIEPYRFLATEYGVPGVVTGFEPVDVLQGIAMLLRQLAERDGIKLPHHADCGLLIFDREQQDVHAGGSGCGCSAAVLNGYFLPKLQSGELGRIIFMATGALMSTTSSQQGETIPGVAHAVVLESPQRGKKE